MVGLTTRVLGGYATIYLESCRADGVCLMMKGGGSAITTLERNDGVDAAMTGEPAVQLYDDDGSLKFTRAQAKPY